MFIMKKQHEETSQEKLTQ